VFFFEPIEIIMTTIAVIGLGYVGLPLAVEFAKHFRTIGYDLSATRVANIRKLEDPTGEVSYEQFIAATQLEVTDDPREISVADFIIVAVPTPVDEAHRPDFTALISSSTLVGKNMRRGAVVVYESTVYPGATEEICIPILEKESGYIWRKDFFIGYSPERINPGDKVHTLTTIVKVVAGDTPETLDTVAQVYETVVKAGVHRASSIKVAEAAKVIENTQRDLNIALMNELSMIFRRVGIDTIEVLKAAGTKWNFLPFRPGLVGGHCIGVDPYYLTHKAEKLGYIPQVILAGRRINDAMGPYVARQAIKEMIKRNHRLQNADVIVLGLTFKENVPDLRNSKVIDVIRELESYGLVVHVHDPIASASDALHEYNIVLKTWDQLPKSACVLMAVNHQQYIEKGPAQVMSLMVDNAVFVDVKSAMTASAFTEAGHCSWSL
jgi:UDP-N-acetyl-D-glucosamine/UDP-N-acetyl-D-galactosamine dehydrogenase